MNTAVKLPLHSANPLVLRDLQKRYPKAEMHILVDEIPAMAGAMNESLFWEIIGKLDWKKDADEAILAPAVAILSRQSEQAIRQFSEILARKLYALDGERLAKEDAWSDDPEAHFSVDDFLYARCCVVANGRDFYENVRREPSKMPKGFTFESLLSLPREAWKMKTGQDDYFQFTEVWVETFSNPDGWPGITPLRNRILENNG